MKFRLKLFRLHFATSAAVLSVVLGGLYLGWYHWPGWYLAKATPVIIVLAGVDLALGPLLTLIIANPTKNRRELMRDIAIIATVQLLALGYGSVQLWNGRPLYYAFSNGILQIVQAYDIDAQDASLARGENSEFAPHWYSLPRWVWAPEPAGGAPAANASSTTPTDYSTLPRYFKPWEAGLGDLRSRLQAIDAVGFFLFNEKTALKAQMQEGGFNLDERNVMPMTGRGRPVLVVFDAASVKIRAILKAR
jgi:hypothetical protein